MIEQNCLCILSLREIGQRQVAVGLAKERIELDGLVVRMDCLLESAVTEIGVPFRIPLRGVQAFGQSFRWTGVTGLICSYNLRRDWLRIRRR